MIDRYGNIINSTYNYGAFDLDGYIQLIKDTKAEIDRMMKEHALSAAKGDDYWSSHMHMLKENKELLTKYQEAAIGYATGDITIFVDGDKWNPIAGIFPSSIQAKVKRAIYVSDTNVMPATYRLKVTEEYEEVDLYYLASCGGDVSVYINRKEDMEEFLEAYNTCWRQFKCKDCGKVSESLREDDKMMIKRGLKPVQRCKKCRANRRIMKGGTP